MPHEPHIKIREQTSKQYAVNQNRPLTTPDNGSVATGLQHALQRLELPWQRASTTSSTTMVAGLQQAAAPRASVAIG
eukprot:scaffold61746_cov66-Phaeocystis_antarctica.AAC.3